MALALALLAAAGPAAGVPYERCGPPVGGLPGPEDLALDDASAAAPRLIVSSAERRNRGDRGDPGDPPGDGLYALPLGPGPLGEAELLADSAGGCPLRPHGISLVRSARDRIPRLYAVQHALGRDDDLAGCRLARSDAGSVLLHTIEVFRMEGARLVHEERLAREGLLPSPNDLVALANGHLYVTNELTFRGLHRLLIEGMGLYTWSFVAHYDGERWRRFAGDVRYANGIAAAGDRLYVAGTIDEAVHVFRRDPETGALLERLEPIPVGSAVDNLSWSRRPRRLIVAAHPRWLDFLRHARNPDHPSPSEVYAIDPASTPPLVERTHANEGSAISAASVAVLHDDALYLGQVFDRGVVRCTRDF